MAIAFVAAVVAADVKHRAVATPDVRSNAAAAAKPVAAVTRVADAIQVADAILAVGVAAAIVAA